ncbi:hypothetical protein EHM92_01515 [bacterium]|nr:MAG: hypothetical protein EHM92_01515 [bacterium]
MKLLFISRLAGLFALLIAGQNMAFSCPVCFGALDDPATNGMAYAIITLLGITGGVLAGFVSFFLRLGRGSRGVPNERSEP